MDNAKPVNVLDSLYDLPCNQCGVVLPKELLVHHVLKQVDTLHQLRRDVQMSFGLEVLFELDDAASVHDSHDVDFVAASYETYIMFFFETSVSEAVSIIFIAYSSPVCFSMLRYTMLKLPVPSLSIMLYSFCTATPLKVCSVSAHFSCYFLLGKYSVLAG